MGKVLIIVVFATALSGTLYSAQLHIGGAEQNARASSQSISRLAEDVAQSGYAIGVQRLNEDFSAFSETTIDLGSGSADIVATEMPNGGIRLRSTGRLADATYPIEGEYIRTASTCNLLGALFLNTQISPVVSLVGTGFNVRGVDTQPASRAGGRAVLDGPGFTVAGILADTLVSQSFSVPLGSLGTLNAGITLGGVTDEGYLRDLIGCTLRTVTAVLDEAGPVSVGNRVFRNQSFGTPAAPAISVVEGDATFRGVTRGYGVLLVEGDLIAEDDFIWEGLILTVGDGASRVTLADSARVYGAMLGSGLPVSSGGGILGSLPLPLPRLLSSLLDGTGAILGPLAQFRRPFSLSMSDEAGIFHSEEALGRLADLLPTVTGETKIVVVNERFGLAAGP